IDVTHPNAQPLPIALPDLHGSNQAESDFGRGITQVISADLERSGLFRPLDPKSFIQNAANMPTPPRFADWRLINAQALVTGDVTTQPDGRLRVEFRLWDVFAGTQMTGFAYTTTRENM